MTVAVGDGDGKNDVDADDCGKSKLKVGVLCQLLPAGRFDFSCVSGSVIWRSRGGGAASKF